MSSPKAEKRRQSRRFHITDSKYCTSSELISLIIYSLKLKSLLLLKHSRLTVIKSCKIICHSGQNKLVKAGLQITVYYTQLKHT